LSGHGSPLSNGSGQRASVAIVGRESMCHATTAIGATEVECLLELAACGSWVRTGCRGNAEACENVKRWMESDRESLTLPARTAVVAAALLACAFLSACADRNVAEPSVASDPPSAPPASQAIATAAANGPASPVVGVGTSVVVQDRRGALLEITALDVVPGALLEGQRPGWTSLEVLLRYRFLRQRDDLHWGSLDWRARIDGNMVGGGYPGEETPGLGAYASGQGAGRTVEGWIRIDVPPTGAVHLAYAPEGGDEILTTFDIRLRDQ
jgi:hypothetical protein